MQRRVFIGSAFAALLPGVGTARPRAYKLGQAGARITYTFQLSGVAQTGTVPINSSQISIDPDDLTASRVTVTADVRRARTGLIFATEALKGPSMLDAGSHPTARFVTTAVRLGPNGRISNGASIEGDLTLRGVTRVIRFDANVYRPNGSAKQDLSRLTVKLRGTLSRANFGATGYSDLVADTVGMEIDAEIVAA